MTDLLEQAIAETRALPDEVQDEVATVILALADKRKGIYRLNPDERASIERGRAEADRGEFATDEQMDSIWAEFER